MSQSKRVTVVFCPRCGSTDAGESDSEHAPLPRDTQMVCGHCLHSELCDDRELELRWKTTISLEQGAPLPRFVFVDGRLIETLRRFCAVPLQGEDTFGSRPAVRALRERVEAAWTEPHRRYHSLQHLAECLRWLDDPRIAEAIAERDEVELALFLHDLLYDTTRSDNEQKSAEESRAMLSALDGADPPRVERVCAMIMATRDHAARTDDERVMLDIDLSILGADERRFAEYEQQIREEFNWVDAEAYAMGRRAVLAKFAARRPIYRCAPLREALESVAHENLARALGTAPEPSEAASS